MRWPWQSKQGPENVMKSLARSATGYASAYALSNQVLRDSETSTRRDAINADIANWGLLNATFENMLLSRRAAQLPEDTIIPYGSHSGNTQTNKMGTISGLAIGFVLLVALLGLLSMMGIIPKPGTPTNPVEPPAWTIEQVPCPPNVEPGTVIMESRTADYPELQEKP